MKRKSGQPKRKVEAERDLYAREARALSNRFEEKVRELSVIRRIGETLKYVRDVRRVFGFVLDIILEETNAETCSIMLYDRRREMLGVRAAKSQKNWTFDFYSDLTVSNFCLKAGQGVAGLVIAEQKAIYIPDVQKDARYVTAAENRSEGSLLCLPLVINNRVEGVVNLSHPRPNAFGDDVQRLIAIAMDQVALALNHVRVFDDLQQLNLSLEHKIAHATRHLQEANAQLHQEIQDHEQAEVALKQAKEEAEKANHAKSDFLANMSHEIRTPLNAILGITQLLDDTALDRAQQNYIDMLKNSATALFGLLNGILDFSKIEAGQYDQQIRPIDIGDLCRSVYSMFAVKASAKGLALIYLPQNEESVIWPADAGALRQVLINIVGNAIKFTSCGEVKICTRVQDQTLLFAISDTGPGISKENQKTIFEPFRQGDSSSEKRYEGTGLGLSIASRLVALMGGKIRLESELSQGSTFYISLPYVQNVSFVNAFADMQPLSEKCGPFSVLMVEDNEINQFIAQKMLENRGHRVVIAENAEKGIALFKAKPFDVVLMDLQMPGMDGFAATRAMREFERETDRAPTPIVAVTAHALDEIRAACINAGMSDFVAKPFVRETLLAIVEQNATGSGQNFIQTRTAPPLVERNKKVFDREEALRQVVGNDALLQKMCMAFFNKRYALQSDMQAALDAGDFAKLKMLAHRFKGTLAAFFAEDALDVVLALEKMAAQADQSGLVVHLPLFWEKLDDLYRAMVAEGVLQNG